MIVILDAFTGAIGSDGVTNPVVVDGATKLIVVVSAVVDGVTKPIVVVSAVVDDVTKPVVVVSAVVDDVTKPVVVVVTGINVVDGVKPFVGSAVGPEIGKK